ncbi:MAG: phytanoyl-CoA dioxygenase [Pseudomonadota bacterium]
MADAAATLSRRGSIHLSGLIADSLSQWHRATHGFFELGKPGHRISNCPELGRLASDLTKNQAFIAAAGMGWACVRAIAFNKSPSFNWSLGWHQDRTIAVTRRENLPGFENWSIKDGVTHVEPPFQLLERMVTLRVHLDAVNDENAPLLVADRSHRFGKVAEEAVESLVNRSTITTCHAEAGDGWLYATPILHASARSSMGRARRVIHLDFSRDALPAPLDWAGVC